MSNYAFCTLVYGEKYTELSKTLIEQITSLGETIFVYTNNPSVFEPKDGLIIIPYTKQYFSFHEKLTVVRECLKTFDTAVFLDSDVVLQDIEDLNFLSTITPGLHIFATFGNITNAGTNKIKATKDGKDVEFAKRTKISVDKNHITGVQTKGSVIMTVHGFIDDDKKKSNKNLNGIIKIRR